MRYNQHTSESVSDGHPDKLADQISDAILDEVLSQDPDGRCACEVLLKEGLVVVAGEITARATLDYERIVGDVFREVYGREQAFEMLLKVGEQSLEIAHGVDHELEIGAGDQGIMYGYATNETPNYMPMPIDLSHQLMLAHKKLRQNVSFLGADAKTQVTVQYREGKPAFIKSVVFSTQHDASVSLETVRDYVRHALIDEVVPKALLTEDTRYWINPSGTFIRGGPSADCGLTGRKLMVDTYGGFSLHGGGAFSGKDYTKVDRTAAYMARYCAKHVVAAGLAERCEVCLAYAIGVSKPVMIEIDTFGTHRIPEADILALIKRVFDFTPKGMIDALSLRQPIYGKTAAFGHFGRSDVLFPWEKLDRLDEFKDQ